jgi:excisionase family DNA binding protein
MDEKIPTPTMTADEAHALLGGNAVINRSSFYAAINRNEVPHLRLGKRILIPRVAFMRWLESAGVVAASQGTA